MIMSKNAYICKLKNNLYSILQTTGFFLYNLFVNSFVFAT